MNKVKASEKAETKDWKAANPLKLWRAENAVMQTEVARKIGVSDTNIQNWERGGHFPRKSHMAKITTLTGITEQQWREWYNAMEIG